MMKEDIRAFAKLGLVHHLLYPRCTLDARYHADTLKQFVQRRDIEAFDCCVPYDDALRKELIPVIKNCGKDVSYSLHLFPARKIPLSSLDIQEQAITRLVMKDQIKVAAEAGATGFVFVSGADVPDNRPAAQEAFLNFCRWFCRELAPHGMTALLEPFDRTIDKKFLYGPTVDCVRLIETLHEEGITNIGIELDYAHLPMMYEDFEEATMICGKYIKRVHLGNCVFKKNPNSPLYGDLHPPIGIEDGEIDVPELVTILRSLLKIGYLDPENRKPLIMEMTPFPGKDQEYTIGETLRRLNEAWSQV